MNFGAVFLALSLCGCWAGLHLAIRARNEARTLRRINSLLEARAEQRSRDLVKALAAAEAQSSLADTANRSKTEFLARMSHELLRPLHAVIGFADVLILNKAADPLSRHQHQAVEQIRSGGARLLSLVEEVLSLADVEAGRTALRDERIDPMLIVRQVCSEMLPMAKTAGIDLREPPRVTGMAARGDRDALKKIVTVLLANAIQYNQKDGMVLIDVKQSKDGIGISVRDTGPGLPTDRLDEVFEPFNRLGRDASSVPGVGIGLSVARSLVQSMGGQMEVASREGEGAVFTVRLRPMEVEPRSVVASPVPQANLPPATILYVDDNPSNVILMRHIFLALGSLELHVAGSGPQGLALTRDLQPDIILLDLNLPGMDGYEVKARLAQDPLTKNLPVVALSGRGGKRDVLRGREAGFADYLTKPLHIPALVDTLSRILEELKPDDHFKENAA